MTRSARRLGRLAGTCTAAVAVTLAGLSTPAVGHGENPDQESTQLAAQVPVATSNNVELVGKAPNSQGISGDFSRSTEHFYVSSLDGISVYDTSNPRLPLLVGELPLSNFENEAMNYGERRKDGKLTDQFVLVGVDLQAAGTDPQHVNPGDGQQVIIVDVSDPANPFQRSEVDPVSSSTHTVSCLRQVQCRFAYSAGNRGTFSIIDLRNLDKPVEVDSNPNKDGVQGFKSPALEPSLRFRNGAGHKWNFDRRGHGFHTGAAGTAVFDVTNPTNPKLLNTTTAVANPQTPEQKARGYNDFIHHNSWHPHEGQFKANSAPRLSNGNVLLITEEDYLETDCSKAGSFQTWKINSFGKPIRPLDKVELTDLGGPTEVVKPRDVFCSAHWFDYHQSGIVAIGYYGGGTRLLDVRDPRNIKSFGYAVGGQTWDSYWAPQRRRNGVAEFDRTNLLYSVDLVDGLTVYKVNNLPAGNAGR
jgi:hypothetical protein